MPPHSPTPNNPRIPDTPEQLFAQLTAPLEDGLCPNFDELSPAAQRLTRTLHSELVAGHLNDGTFNEILITLLTLWQGLNGSAMDTNDDLIVGSDEVDEDCFTAALSFHRIDQHIQGLQVLARTMPPDANQSLGSGWSHYTLGLPPAD